MKNTLHTLMLAPLMALGLLQPAAAVVVNPSFGAGGAIAYGSGFSSVVQVTSGGGACSGTVISATAILTAQHCTFGSSAASLSVRFDQNGDGAFDATMGAASKYEFDATNVLLDGTDFAILTLAGPLPAWALPFDLYAGDPFGQVVTMVGFGRNGVGSIGAGFGVRWAADNVVDAVGTAPGGGSGTANIVSTDFDDGSAGANTLSGIGSAITPLAREGTTAGGDSGGPLLVNLGGHYAIAGVLSGGTRADSGFGDISWWTGISRYRTEIESFGGVFITGDEGTLPEPGSLALVLLALGATSALRRQSSGRS